MIIDRTNWSKFICGRNFDNGAETMVGVKVLLNDRPLVVLDTGNGIEHGIHLTEDDALTLIQCLDYAIRSVRLIQHLIDNPTPEELAMTKQFRETGELK